MSLQEVIGQSRAVLIDFRILSPRAHLKKTEKFTVLSRIRSLNEEELLLKNFLKLHVAWLLEDHLHYCEAVFAMAQFCGEVTLSQASSLCAPATSPDYYVDVDGEAKWSFANLNAVDEPLNHTALKKTFQEQQEACHRAYVVAPSSLIDVASFAIGCVPASVLGDILSKYPPQGDTEASELQVVYDRLVAQLSNLNLQYDPWRLPAHERRTELIDLQTSLATFMDKFKLLQGQLLLMKRRRSLFTSSGTSTTRKWVSLRRC